MGMYYKTGDLLDAPVDYICHQVNCQGRMGSGIAKQIKERWPVVYEGYMAGFEGWVTNNLTHLKTVFYDGHMCNVPTFQEARARLYPEAA